MGSIEVQVIRVSTPFSTTEQFVGTFRNYVTEDSCFIPSTTMKTVGVETGFSIRLADGTPVLRGLGVVLDSWATDENPWHKPGIRLGLRKLTKETRTIFEELQHARLARGSSRFLPTGENTPLVRAENELRVRVENNPLLRAEPPQLDATKRHARAESISDTPDAIDTSPEPNAPVVISFFDANNAEQAPPSSGRPTRSLRVVETDAVRTTNVAGFEHGSPTERVELSPADAWADDCAVPMEITEEHENATERVEMTDLPVRGDVKTMLGFAPLPKPARATTERERDTSLGMAPIVIDGLVAVGPIAIESMAIPHAMPHSTTLPIPAHAPSAPPTLPMMAQVVSLPGLAHLWDPPELAALAALETTAIIERPQRRTLSDWWSRLVWRVRAWYRTRSMR